MSANSLCFKEAFEARERGEIELQEFLRHIVAHYGGLRHQTDAEGQRPYFAGGFEVEVRDLVLSKNVQPLEDDAITIIHSIFLSGFQGDIDAVRKHIGSFNMGAEYFLRPLMKISTERGDPQLLRVCFENGFSLISYIDSQQLLSPPIPNNPGAAWLDVLFDFNFRRWRTDPELFFCKWGSWDRLMYMGVDCARWWVEHGGHTPRARGLFQDAVGWPGAPTFQFLLNHFGVDWFEDSGTLQLAVKNHDFETVKMLVEAGADVNEEVTDWQTDIREHRKAPLPALKQAVFAKSEKMIRYLAEHGAKISHEVISDPYYILPEEYRVFLDLVIEIGAVKK